MNARKLAIAIGNFSFLNDFVTIDVLFIRAAGSTDNMIPVTSSVVVKSHIGLRVETRIEKSGLRFLADFKDGYSIGSRVRLCELGVADFSSLDVEIMFKFREKRSMAGVISVTYLDTSHAILSLLVRMLIFFTGLVVLTRLWSIDFSGSNCGFQLKALFWAVLFVVISANPLYVFSYFTDSPLLPLIDAFIALGLVIITCSVTLVCLEIDEGENHKLNCAWVLNKSSSFLIAGSVYFAASILSQFGSQGIIFTVFDIGRSLAAAICFLRMAIGLMSYEARIPEEKLVMGVMIGVTLIVSIICEVCAFVEPLLMSDHEIQLFTQASVSIYVFFLTRFYWPIDPGKYVEAEMSSDGFEEDEAEETEEDDD
jgi:hypothetical protein